MIFLTIITSVFFIMHFRAELQNSESEKIYIQSELEKTKDELNDVKDKLDEANSNIEEAKSSAWETYEDMGDALDNLETVE